MRTTDHLYTRTYHPGAFRAEWEQLFNVTEDPHLTEDLLPTQPELGHLMRSYLTEWWNFYAGRPGSLPDPMQTTLQEGPVLYNPPREYAEHLRRTGRDHLAKDLEERLAVASGTVPVSWHGTVSGDHALGGFIPRVGYDRPNHPAPGRARNHDGDAPSPRRSRTPRTPMDLD